MKNAILTIIAFCGLGLSTASAQHSLTPVIGSGQCVAELLSGSGRLIDSFVADSCRRALRQCENELYRRQSQGLNPNAYCETNSSANQPPSYNGDYGPARTVRWQDFGSSKIDKVAERITIRANYAHVNEILFRADKSSIRIQRVSVRTANGQVFDLPYSAGTIRDGREIRLRLHRNYSVRVDVIEIEAVTNELFGSRGRLQTILGLAY